MSENGIFAWISDVEGYIQGLAGLLLIGSAGQNASVSLSTTNIISFELQLVQTLLIVLLLFFVPIFSTVLRSVNKRLESRIDPRSGAIREDEQEQELFDEDEQEQELFDEDEQEQELFDEDEQEQEPVREIT